jgi:hypothetical protein
LKGINVISSSSEAAQIVDIKWGDRWQAYRRLQELGISCSCSSGQPLQVVVDDSIVAIQLWSVVRQFNESRYELAVWLNNCLQQSSYSS